MKVVQAPNKVPDGFKVFLAGSIEMDLATKWQEEVIGRLSKATTREDLVVLNPRRDNWDSSWEQKISNHQFNQQVTWEMDGLDSADIALFYFDPKTKSPVTLLELGLTMPKVDVASIVCCPDGFWRQGNVEITCKRHNIYFTKSLNVLTDRLLAMVAPCDSIELASPAPWL